ncbi:HAD family acid phosphatase [Streptomyces sp. NPDC050145]|uniref:HAD family acid phosphatase n=1 Tax=Streptomyces sp. NPDC050145 TaxID=3365602 RepID=UPI00378ACA45
MTPPHRTWTRRASVIGISATAVLTLAMPAQAATATTTDTAAATATTTGDVDYATWQRDCQAVADQALPYLKDRIAHSRPGEKQAMVFDIDNTTLESDYGFHYPAPANKPVLALAEYAREHGVAMFFVTARPGIIKGVTDYNLKHVGYEVDGLYVRGFVDLFKDVADYKTAQRAAIEAKGYTIIANVGNNTTDLTGGHAERTYKLPDYDGQLS